MRIAVVGQLPLPGDAIRGGVERVVSTLVSTFKKVSGNVKINVITLSEKLDTECTMKTNGIVVHYVPRKSPLFFSLFKESLAFRGRVEEIEPDIVHVHAPIGILRFDRRYPTVLSVHGISWRETRFHRDMKSMVKPFFQRYAIKKTGHIIVLNPYVKTEIDNLNAKARYYIVENPVDDRFFHIKDNPSENRLLYSGRFSSLKNPSTLIKALALVRERIPTVKLCMVGEIIDEGYFQEVLELIRKKRVSDSVEIKGLVDDEGLVREYSACSLFCLPSRQESAPVAIAEAMAAGRPVIASRAGGIPWMVKDGETGLLFDPLDEKTLAKHIITLLSNEKLRERIGLAGRETARRRWSPVTAAKKTLAVYKEVIGEWG